LFLSLVRDASYLFNNACPRSEDWNNDLHPFSMIAKMTHSSIVWTWHEEALYLKCPRVCTVSGNFPSLVMSCARDFWITYLRVCSWAQRNYVVAWLQTSPVSRRKYDLSLFSRSNM
jgi:hypothetical protein